MATPEEIERRIDEVDQPRSSRRAAAAKRVVELASQRASVAEQLSALERELGDILAESSDVIEIDELARFTDLPVADLTRWLNDRKTTRPKRKRPATAPSSERNGTSQQPSTANRSLVSPLPVRPGSAVPRVGEPQ